MTAVDLVVVGGGMAGLVVAHDAARAGLSVRLLDAADATGGLLRGAELASGLVLDVGAESFATRTSGVVDLIEDAGLPVSVVAPAPGGAHLAYVADGVVARAPLPRRTVLGIPAEPLNDDVVRILGIDAARRVASETVRPVSDADEQASLADLVADRCGAVLVERLVDPLCRSVYSRPARAVRLSQLHPALWQAFVASGSLTAAAAAIAADGRAGAAVAGIEGGMWRLADAVRAAAEQHGAVIETGVTVTAVSAATHSAMESATDSVMHAGVRDGVDASESGVAVPQVHTVDGEVITAQHVVVATGSAAARRLLGGAAAGAPAADSPAPVRVVAALVRGPALDAHPVGTGVIVAADVPGAAKALTHVTAKWAWAEGAVRAAGLGPGHHVVRLSARDPHATGLDTPAEVAAEIGRLTGIRLAAADVVALAHQVWTDAVATPPVDAARAAVLAAGGIHLAGAAVAGTGLASVVPHARALADKLIVTSTVSTKGSVHV